MPCPECGEVYVNLQAHQGKGKCRRRKVRMQLEQDGYVHTGDLWEHLVQGQIPKIFQRFLRQIPSSLGDSYLPKWVCSIIIAGHWTEESVTMVANDTELQIALAVEYDIRNNAPRIRTNGADKIYMSQQDFEDICAWGKEDQNGS